MLAKFPMSFRAERIYIAGVLLHDFLGLNTEFVFEDRSDVCLEANGRELRVADVLFATPKHDWLCEASLPTQPLDRWDPLAEGLELVAGRHDLPVLYGLPPGQPGFLNLSTNRIDLGLDVFGSAFYMLCRYEEAVRPDRDIHDRFPHTASLAFQEGFLERALVNEYLDVLRACMERLWPGLEYKTREYRVVLSHDVDRPLSISGAKAAQVLRTLVGDVAKRRDGNLALRRFAAIFAAVSRNYDKDPAASFEFIMDVNEQHGLTSTFNFIAGHSGGEIDGNYSIRMPWIISLMGRLHERGQEIGFHPSYNTYLDSAVLKSEFERLLGAAADAGVNQDQWGGRQHFLRWRPGETWRHWATAGLAYDSTLGFAGCPGFRTGTCFEYSVFDLLERRQLELVERPLIVMDTTMMFPEYMQMSHDNIIRKCSELAASCKAFGGNLTLLWHNDNLVSAAQKRLYRDVVAVAVEC